MDAKIYEMLEAQTNIIESLQNQIGLLTELQAVHSEKIDLLKGLIELQDSRIENLESI